MTQEKNDQPILAIYDVSGIQEYIFASSKLRENVGASAIVSDVLGMLLPEILISTKHNVLIEWEDAVDFKVADDTNIKAEIIYNGGGSTIVAYQNKSIYDEVNKIFARRLIETSYTLTLATAYIETDFGNYSEDISRLVTKLESVKKQMLRQRPMGALPITEQEALTGLPITCRYKSENLSVVQMLKRQAADRETQQKSQEKLSAYKPSAIEIEDLISEKGQDAYIAIVHIDGNSMGQSIKEKIKAFKKYKDAVPAMRKLSIEITNIYKEVFDELLRDLQNYINSDQASTAIGKMRTNSTLPIREIIFGGDDITIICNGRLAVPLAAAFLRRLAQIPDPAIPLSACAGVALVHSHYPFNIAYEMAESCCRNAKMKRQQMKSSKMENEERAGYIDFSLSHGGYAHERKEVKPEWVSNSDQPTELLMSPYRITADSTFVQDCMSFDQFNVIMNRLLPESDTDSDAEHIWPRSRLKEIFETYQGNSRQIESLKNEFASRGYRISSLIESDKEIAVLIDALKLMDLFERNLFAYLCQAKSKEECK